MDEQGTRDNNGTYTININKLGYDKGQRKMERISFSRKKPKWLVKLKKKDDIFGLYNLYKL